jgi:hypothetical protein
MGVQNSLLRRPKKGAGRSEMSYDLAERRTKNSTL